MDVDSVRVYTKSELDEAIGNGEFVIYNDGRKVKVARGVTSLETTSVAMPEGFRKVKILAIATKYIILFLCKLFIILYILYKIKLNI